MAAVEDRVTLDCRGKATTEINRILREAAADGVAQVEILNPDARHNLGVCITDPVHLIYRGDVGYYAVSICDHVTAEIRGGAGWGVGENLMDGEVVVDGNAASAAAPSLRGGRVVVKGSVGPRSAIGLKGGELIVGGNAGYMTGFMMQKGRIVICGNTHKALGDSIYDGAIYVGGTVGELGNGLSQEDLSADEKDDLAATLDRYGIRAPSSFKKFVCDGTLHHFKKEDFETWKEIL
ncbi:MAG: glutamate synthase [Alphaproteobacteria bacterium]